MIEKSPFVPLNGLFCIINGIFRTEHFMQQAPAVITRVKSHHNTSIQLIIFQTYAANDAPTAQNNNDTSTATAVPRKDRSDFLKENQDDHDDQPAAAEAAATEERKKKTASKQSGAAKRPLNHSLSAPVFPGYEASAAAVEAAAASVPSLAASWMIDHQPVSWSPGMMRTHAAGVTSLSVIIYL